MHVAISWDIKGASGERWTALNDYMRAAFDKTHEWTRPVSTFYIVKVSGAPDRDAIIKDLQARAQGVTERVYFVVSPIMPAGAHYNGLLPREWWDPVRQKTS